MIAAILVGCVGLYVIAAWFAPVLIRPFLWVIAHTGYRLRVHHRETLPPTGPALIVCNHVTYLDWMFLWAGSPRPLTFVIWSGFDRNPLFRFALSFARTRLIRIDSQPGRPHATLDALNRVTAALDAGQAVVVFAEGTLTRNGQMLPFGRGIELVLRRVKVTVPVIPAYLDNLWGSLWSWSDGRIFWKWPTVLLRRRVSLWFGAPLPSTATAAEVRLAVQECAADCAIVESDELLPVNRGFITMAASWRNIFRPAMVDVATGTERRLTWGRTLVAVWCLVRWLRPRLGTEPIIGVWLPTGMGGMLVNLALGLLRKTTVNLNYTAGPGPVNSAIQQTRIQTIITAKRFELKMPLELADPAIQKIYLEDALGAISGREKFLTFLTVLLLPCWLIERLLGLTATRLDDPLTIIFSSGSTGEPKGVVLNHRNVATNVDGVVRGIELHRTDRILATLPFFHSFGFTITVWAPAIVGMEAVYFPDPRQAREVGELCRKHRCTIQISTATFLRIYMRRAGIDDFRTLRLLICGAEKLPVKLAQEYSERFGIWPLEGYGCTELSPVVSTNLPDVTVGGVTQIANHLGCVGQPLPGQVTRAFDPNTLQALPPGIEGVLGVKGPNVMVGYYQQPEKTRQVIHEGYYITGDMGLIEPEGFIRITGRLSRFAKIAGEMVPLERLDEELHDLLGHHEERALVVAAVPCEKRGERLIVLHIESISLKLTVAFEGLRSRGLPNLWVPDSRDCFPVESFPTLGSGKLDLRGIVELAMKVTREMAKM